MRQAWMLLAVGCGRLGFVADRAGDAADAVVDAPGYHTTLRLDRVAPGAALADFPLLVVLDDTRAHRAGMAADASDLRIKDATGAALALEIEQAGSAGGPPTIAWVKVPQLAGTSTVLEATFGSPGAGPTGAWSSDFEAVWHLAGDGHDATGHGHDGVLHGTTAASGIVGSARAFASAAQNYIAIPDNAQLAFPTLTAEAWLEMTQQPVAFKAAITRELGTTMQDDFEVSAYAANPNVAINGAAQVSAGTIPINSWHHIALTYDAQTTTLYVDGVAIASSAAATGAVSHSARPIFLGADCDSGNACPDASFFDGALDEVRLAKIARTPAWLAYQVASQRDQVITYVPGVD